jgi:hypothetical protein
LAELPITPQLSTPRAFTAASVGELVAGALVWAKAPSDPQANAVRVNRRAEWNV